MFTPGSIFIKNMRAITCAVAFLLIACTAHIVRAEHNSGNRPTTDRAVMPDNAAEEESQPIATDIALMEQYGADLKVAVPALLDGLRSDNSNTRKNAAFALGEMGTAARDVVPAIAALKNDPNSSVRWVVENALKKIEGK